MKPRLPKSPLFPYTTLFRSDPLLAAHARRSSRAVRDARAGDLLDRKSTRLNSSHVAISYAVFCLKKKTIFDFICIAFADISLSTNKYVCTSTYQGTTINDFK